MKNINKKALDLKKYNSMFSMLIVSIAIFFVFIELITNVEIIEVMDTIDYTLSIWLKALSAILAIFAFIYCRYLYIYIFDEKVRDYGILASLGVSKKKIKQSFIWSLGKFNALELFYGLLSGTLLYYVILIFLNRILNTSFSGVPLNGYVMVSITYFVIYFINVLLLEKKIDNMNIMVMVSYKKEEKKIKNPILFQNIGFGLLFLGVILLMIFKSSSTYGLVSAFLPMLCLTGSAYFLILSFPHWFTKLFAVSRIRYLHNLFYISQLRTTYKRYAKLLSACTIIVIFSLYITIIGINFTATNNEHDFESPFDFVVSGNDMNNELVSNVQKFEVEQSQLFSVAYLVEITEGTIQWDDDEFNHIINIMPERTYNKLTEKKLNIQPGTIIVLSQIDRQNYNIGTQFENGIEWGFQPPGNTSFKIENNIYQGEIVKEIWEIAYNINNQNQRTYIISNSDYDRISKGLDANQWKYFVTASNSDYLTSLHEQLQVISSQIEIKKENIDTQNKNILVVSFIVLLAVILLLCSLISLIILRIQQNIKDERNKYSNLYSIGYTYKQLHGEIKKEMLTLFFLPLAIGSIITIFYTLFSNVKVNMQILFISIITVVLFFVVEYIFYRITVNMLLKQYLK